MSDLIDAVAAGSGPVGVLLGVFGKSWFDRRRSKAEETKIDAEAAQIISATAVQLVEPLRAQIKELSDRVEIAIDHIIELRIFIATHVPDKTPPPMPFELGI